MKNVFKQSGKALCYFILYFLGQIIISFVIQIGMGIYAGMQLNASGLTLNQEETVAYALNFYSENMGIDLAGRAIFTLLFLLIFFAIRRKKVTREMNLTKTPAIKYVAAALGAIFIIFTVNMSMTLFIPQEGLQEFSEASKVLYAYPLWQAILANALVVPILEEVIFRGLIFSRLQKAMPNVVVALITSVLFGIVHGQLVWMLFAFIVGLLLSYVRIKTGSILPTIMMHVIINTYATLVSYNLFSIGSEVIAIALYVIGIIALAGCFFLMHKVSKEEKKADTKIEVSTVVI